MQGLTASPYAVIAEVLAWPPDVAVGQYRAHLLALREQLDGASDFTCLTVSAIQAPILPSNMPDSNPTTCSIEKAKDNVRMALAGVQKISQATATFVGCFLSDIEVRAEEPMEVPGSFSEAGRIGHATIFNANAHVATASYLEDAIVHEAIHGLVYRVERWVGDGARYTSGALGGARVKSPWTGNVLSARHFVHACFVWFGLANFWTLPSQADNNPSEAGRLAQTATMGFQSDRFDSTLRDASVADGAKQAIRAIKDDLLRRGLLTDCNHF